MVTVIFCKLLFFAQAYGLITFFVYPCRWVCNYSCIYHIGEAKKEKIAF